MSLEQAAKHIAAHGRGPDTELVHMTKGEIKSLQALAKAGGGSLTINPKTGLAEAGFLEKLLPMAVGAAAMYFTGGAAGAAMPGLFGMSMPATIGLGAGAFETARTGSLQKGLMAGLGAYGGAGLAGGLMGAGAAEIGKTAASGAVEEAGKQGLTGEAYNQAVQKSVAEKMGGLSNFDKLSAGLNNPAASVNAMGGASGLAKTGLMAAIPALMGGTQQTQAPVSDSKMPQRLEYNVGRPMDAQGNPITPAPDVPTYESGMGSNFGREQNYFPNAGYSNLTDAQAKLRRGYADGGEVQFPYQEPVVRMAEGGLPEVNSMTGEMNEFADGGLNLAGEYSRNLKNDLENTYAKAERKNDKTTMRSVKSESELRERLKNPKMYATGGLSDLGGYSDGGRLLKGPGDGVSDSIPATIGNKRPARLADGEFVVPARIVSELGNGSTEAGARKLYAMLDRVQAARKKSIGKGKVAKNSRADNLLPA